MPSRSRDREETGQICGANNHCYTFASVDTGSRRLASWECYPKHYTARDRYAVGTIVRQYFGRHDIKVGDLTGGVLSGPQSRPQPSVFFCQLDAALVGK